MSMEGSSDGESFGLFLREVLCPTLKRGQIVVMDNLSVHRGAWVRELIEQKGAEVLLLSLLAGLQPHRGSLLQGEGTVLRRAKARTRGALFEATHRALFGDTVEDARGFFGHCGYGTPQALSISKPL